MQAMILTWPPQLLQVSMSMLKTRFRRCAQVAALAHPCARGISASMHVMAARRSAGVRSSVAAALALLPLPRLAGVTRARCALLGANTPWKRVRLAGFFFGSPCPQLADSRRHWLTRQ